MTVFEIDLETHRTREEIFGKLLQHISAPVWHGKNLDALWESVAYTENGTLAPPYSIHFTNVKSANAESLKLISQISLLFSEAKAEQQVDVTCICIE